MKVVLLLVAIAIGVVVAQDVNGWSDWTECPVLCGGGVSTRTCTNTALPCGNGGITMAVCNPLPCQNCTVTGFWKYSRCTKDCGTGTAWMARTIIDEAGPGGTPCPILNYTYTCNTWMCYETLNQFGYWFWGPIKGPGPITFTFARIDANFDVFLFDQENFFQYQYDAAREKPYQTGYTALRSALNVENSKIGPVDLDPAIDYYLVVDHTGIGAAKGTDNGDGTRSYNLNRFYYQIEGVEAERGYTTDGTTMIAGVNGASTVRPTFTMVAALVASAIAIAVSV